MAHSDCHLASGVKVGLCRLFTNPVKKSELEMLDVKENFLTVHFCCGGA
jgi:Fe-S oxidoreductase